MLLNINCFATVLFDEDDAKFVILIIFIYPTMTKLIFPIIFFVLDKVKNK